MSTSTNVAPWAPLDTMPAGTVGRLSWVATDQALRATERWSADMYGNGDAAGIHENLDALTYWRHLSTQTVIELENRAHKLEARA